MEIIEDVGTIVPPVPVPRLTLHPGLEQQAVDRCALWGVKQLDWIPIPGQARREHWATCVPGTKQAVGRNHPGLGAWLFTKYGRARSLCADPMVGAGGLWVWAVRPKPGVLYGADCVPDLAPIALKNLDNVNISAEIQVADARTWRPPEDEPMDFVMTSFPFKQNHPSGNSDGQKKFREQKRAYSMQAFTAVDAALTKSPSKYWLPENTPAVYRQIFSYLKPGGLLLSVCKDYIRKGQEVGEIKRHIDAAIAAGFVVDGLHPREVYPTLYMSVKMARNPALPCVRIEWTLVLSRP